MLDPSSFEQSLTQAGLTPIAGVDEAGRGACAGPLVAAAVILDPNHPIDGIADSKTLTARARERLYAEITDHSLAWAVAAIEPAECDSMGVHVANIRAMREAVQSLDVPPAFVLTDAFSVDGLTMDTRAVIKGDRYVRCIGAASIVAKVTRDRVMMELDQRFPQYGFASHKGYSTARHQAALDEYGPCKIHRLSYANVARTIRDGSSGTEKLF